MRAGAFLEALAARYRVSLLVVPLFVGRTPQPDDLARRLCERVVEVPPQLEEGLLSRFRRRVNSRPELMRLFAAQAPACMRALRHETFDVIHAFRFYTAALALSLAASQSRRPRLHLDIDDIESLTRSRLARLCEANGDHDEARHHADEAMRYSAAEERILPEFDRLYVCSADDSEWIRKHAGGEVRVAPNVVRPPEEAVSPLTTHPFTFLFVGTLGYYPNQDALLYFSRHILPGLRALAPCAFRIRIVGRGMPDRLRAAVEAKDVRLIGEVFDVSREYADADAIIVPIRAGGGTRIKVLEAFAYRRPVVATSIGVEGIDVHPEVHYLLGDRPADFAGQCARLMQNPSLSRGLVERAYRLVTLRYSPQALLEAVTDSEGHSPH
jgi:polysaccharide biosynthesis protein PslH